MGVSDMRRLSLTLAPYLALLLVVAGLTWYAVGARGDEAHQPHLHDSGIWVVNNDVRSVGRVDKSIGQLDSAYFASPVPGGGGLDVVQEGAAVVAVDRATRALSAIDPATIDVPDGASTTLPQQARVDLRGGTLAVVESATGNIWATRFDPEAGSPDVGALAGKEKPQAVAGAGALLAVDEQGAVFAYAPATGTLTTLPPEGGTFGAPQVSDIGKSGAGTTMTTVGDRVVLLSRDGTVRVVGGGSAHLDASHAVLQQPGPAADSVLVTTDDGFLSVDLDSGDITTIGHGSGTPVAPVRLGACEYAAWAGAAAAVLTKCGAERASVQEVDAARDAALVFRVNRGQIVLNDTTGGDVWEVDSRLLTTLDDWESFQTKKKDNGKAQQQQIDHGDRERPLAKDDDFGVRPGRATVVHPLDNDYAPEGKLLAITRVGQCQGCRVQISPDGQTLQVTLSGSGAATFDYWIDDGDESDDPVSASVHVAPSHGDGAPRLRPNYTPPVLYVAAGADLDVPVLRDWRDPDGDPLTVDAVSTGGGDETGTAQVVDDSIIRFTAPAAGRDVTLSYTVGDGDRSTSGKIVVHVQGPGELVTHPATAEPDVVSAVQGRSVQFEPLANDLAGSDPGDPSARLEINGDITAPAGTTVKTDPTTGEVTFRADSARTYLLSYDAGFGDAALSRGIIRVDVRADGAGGAPQTMPDAANLYGSDSTLVDVLANDTDPSGGVLTVDSLDVHDPDAVTASIVDGRWVRAAATGASGHRAQVIDYTVNDGEQSAEGQLVVTPRPPRDQSAPVTAVDRATVRAGSSITVPVLNNDASPSGDALHLVETVKPGSAGALPVEDATGRTDPALVGKAYASAGAVRYVAPPKTDGGTYTVSYVAANTHGETAPGKLVVTVTGTKAVNQPPTPPALVGRVTAGGTTRIVLPPAGGDPDGDPVSITGLAQAPTLGRIVDVRADSILYQAYPDQTGTDEFQYTVADDRGATATGTVRVGVDAQQLPQPPQAVPDEASAAPGRTVSVDVTGNDQIVAGDDATVTLPKGQSDVSMAEGGSTVQVHVPEDAEGDVTGVYELSDGTGATSAEITVHVRKGYNNPPVVESVYAAEGRGEAVTVNLLQDAYDPDGSTVRVTHVDAPGAITRLVGKRLTVIRGARPRVIPFQVADADGGIASATVYVPARIRSRPELRNDALLTLKPGGASGETRRLSSYVRDTASGPVHFTLADRIWTSPSSLDAEITGDGTFKVRAQPGYSGPGAVSFEVATGATANDPRGSTAVVTVPVQVGTTRPVLTCPQDPVEITQGARITVPVSTLCHVWTADPRDAGRTTLHASLGDAKDLRADVHGQDVRILAKPGARQQVSTLKLTASLGDATSKPAEIQLDVTAAKPPTLAPVRLGDLKAGHGRTIDLRPYFHSGIQGHGGARILSVRGAAGISARRVGATKLRLSASHGSSGQKRVRVTMTDVPSGGSVPASRRVTGTIAVELLDVPDAPRAPIPGVVIRSHEIHLSWSAPHANGSPIDHYRITGAGRTTTCPSTACDVRVPKNGVKYTFRIRAHNGVGWSAPSRVSRPGVADQKPGQVGPVHVTAVGNGRISLAWSRPTTDSSLDGYWVKWPGGSRKVRQPHLTVTGLNNNNRYGFSVLAFNNRMGSGPARRSPVAQSIGRPGKVARPHAQDTAMASTSTAVSLTWGSVSPNGPGPVSYTVIHNGHAVPSCSHIKALSCRLTGIPHNGANHTFSVRATNAGVPGVKGGARQSTGGSVASWKAVGTPVSWNASGVGIRAFHATGRNNQMWINYVVPPSNGARSYVRLVDNGRVLWAAENVRGNRTQYFNMGSNYDHHFYLQVFNEAGRSSSSAVHLTQPFGPLTSNDIRIIGFQKSGAKAHWRVTVNGNGRPVNIRIRTYVNGTHKFDWVKRPPSWHVTTWWTPYRKVGYGNWTSIHVTLTSRGWGRSGSFTKSANHKVKR